MSYNKKCRAVLVALSDSLEIDWTKDAPCPKCTNRARMVGIRAKKG